ncbi:KEOPS complex subunit Bud32 [Candidatus Norongarragalina meridionalis]|nr:KEOPS complex subunit Bud32 [Candidatus Norongarragalina meridionalis]
MRRIGDGAEAVIFRNGKTVLKKRPRKSYRHPILDEQLRKGRTKREARVTAKAKALGVNVPEVMRASDYDLSLSFVAGKRVRDVLDKATPSQRRLICAQIGTQAAILHNAGIIHGDLTTSNLIFSRGKVFVIDFGLSFHSARIEDKAVDLHLLKEALESKHWRIWKQCFADVAKAYEKKAKEGKPVLKRMEEVETRGRYKKKIENV